MSERGIWEIRETGIGERPPTAALPPRWADLVTWSSGRTLEAALQAELSLPDIEITSSQTAALRIAFQTLQQLLPQRCDIIVPACAGPHVVVAAAAAGLKVIACDTTAGSLDLDLDHLARLVGSDTLAVVPTHNVGHLADVMAVRRVVAARSPDIMIIENAAHALGARRDGASAGTLGDIGIFALGGGNGLTIPDTGAFTAKDPRLMRAMREHHHRVWRRDPVGGLGRWAGLVGHHATSNLLARRLVYGRSRRRALRAGDDIEAAGVRVDHEVPITRVGGWRKHAGLAALPRLRPHLAACRTRFDSLARRLQLIPRLIVHQPAPGSEPSALALHVTLPPAPTSRDFIDALWASRHGVSRMVCRTLTEYPDLTGLIASSAHPNARDLATRTISISTAQGLSAAAEEIIVQALTHYVAQAAQHR